MQYRPFGKTGLQVSALGLGCMRFDPEKPELAEQIVDEAIASGVNYFETTRGYIQGRCQHLTAPGLKGRSKGLIVSGKGAVNQDTTAESFRKEMDLQMEILGVDYLEFYQVGWFSLDQLETLRKKGGVPQGKSYVHTTTLVETGIYAIVRHPQIGTAWLLMCTGLMFITQHWISVALGVPAMALAYLDVLKADQDCIDKFGDAYRRYMERAPRVNFVAGIARLLTRRPGDK